MQSNQIRNMNSQLIKFYLILALILGAGFNGTAQTQAFPTAEGYGKWASGGRGGVVVEVTNLEDDPQNPPEGSLRWAFKQGTETKYDPLLGSYKVYVPITIVFRVSGIIDLNGNELKVQRRGVTIAGQTAPGDGICIKGESFNMGGSQNVIVRHLRFRTGAYTSDSTEVNAASVILENGGNFIFDHCSMSWSSEELCDFADDDDLTVQWCIFSEGLYASVNGKGARGYGAVIAGATATYHHNLMAHTVARAPRFGVTSPEDPHVLVDYVNNVNYNFGKATACYGGENEMGPNGTERINFVNNYYKHGPAYPGNKSAYFVRASYEIGAQGYAFTKWHLSGNYIDGSANQALNDDNYLGLNIEEYTNQITCTVDDLKSDHHTVAYPVNTESAHDAFNSIMQNVGAFPRDTVDQRIIQETISGTASNHGSFNNYAVSGIIDSPSDAGGWPEYKTYNTITDEDHDGMDDAWETANGLNPSDPEDRNRITKSGYTALEVYLNGLVGEHIDLDFTISEKKVHDFVVAKDGTGDFTTINEAIDAAPEGDERTTVFIKKGIYEEKIFIGNRWQTSNKIISLIGENVDSVIVTWDDYHGKDIPYPGKDGTIKADGMTASTLTVTSPEFYMENITIKNPSTAAQAEAIYQSGDKQIIKNCKILGNQDTHRTKKGRRYFYFRSTIEGGVDFIYAGGTCYFYQCDIVSNRSGYITAPEDISYKATLSSGKTLRYGFFFKDCDLLATDNVATGDVYLGRPWGPECGSVYLNCRLGAHINNQGWTTMGAGNENSACFAEYKSTNEDGSSLIDVSERINWSQQFNTSDVNNFMLLSRIYSSVSSNKFEPIPMVVAPPAPARIDIENNYLSWPAVSNANGYVIYANGSVIGFNSVNHFTDTLSHETTPVYSVKTVGPHGNLSTFNGSSEDFTESGIKEHIDSPIIISSNQALTENKTFVPTIINGAIEFSKPVSFRVFTITGQEIANKNASTRFNLQTLPSGIYLFNIRDKENKHFSFKIRK